MSDEQRVSDPFEFDDAAYILGGLSAGEHAAFEEHLRTCDACTARVREIEDVPALLALVTADDMRAAEEPMPDTLLPGLLRRGAAQQRRRRWLIGGLASVAAACLVALVVAVWPTTSSQSGRPVADRPFSVVGQSPVRATAGLTAKAWGTAIDVHCHYLPGTVERTFSYDLVVYGRDGTKQTVGSWKLPPEHNISFPAGTWLSQDQIAKIEITKPDGTTILRLTNA